MNKVILMGRLTRDPEIRYSQDANQTCVASFSLAVDRRFKQEGQPEADFFNCSAFGKTAEFIEKYVKKGTKVVTLGRIQNDNYTNREGQKVWSVRIVVEEMEFAESKAASANNQEEGGTQYRSSTSQNRVPASADGFMSIPEDLDDELPFA